MINLYSSNLILLINTTNFSLNIGIEIESNIYNKLTKNGYIYKDIAPSYANIKFPPNIKNNGIIKWFRGIIYCFNSINYLWDFYN